MIKAQASSAIAKATQAKVTAVTVTSPTTADVTYSIVEGGQVALPNQKGQAVLEGGVWKVSAPSFQALLKLEQGQSRARRLQRRRDGRRAVAQPHASA